VHSDVSVKSAYRVTDIVPAAAARFPVSPTMEHRASVKRFVSLTFLNPETGGRTPWMGGSARRKAATYTNRINAHRHPCLECYSNPRSQRWSG
jgi:hypothetical protein